MKERKHDFWSFRNPLVFLICVLAWSLMGTQCRTTDAGTDRLIFEHQQQIVELEERNQDLERRVTAYDDAVGHAVEGLEAIRERSVGMEGEVDELISLFNEYQRRVEQLARDYNTIKNQTPILE